MKTIISWTIKYSTLSSRQKAYEQFSALFNLMTVVGMNQFSSLSHHKQTLAFGPVTVMKKEDYVLTQGHKMLNVILLKDLLLLKLSRNIIYLYPVMKVKVL